MNIKRPLMPGFLKRAEQKLLLNHPGIWSTRVHLVVYYGVLFLLVLATLCFFEPNDLRDYSTTEAWTGFVSILSAIGLIIWLIYLLRFNVFKKYGTLHPLHGLGTFLLYFISTGMLVSFTYVHPYVETLRANMAYSDKELISDINDINVKIFQLEYNQLQTPWRYDTVELVYKDVPQTTVVDSTTVAMVDTVAAVETTAVEPVSANYIPHYRVDSSEFSSKITSADSVIKLKDSLYLVYETPRYQFLNPYLYSEEARAHVLNDYQLFKKVYRHPPAAAERERIMQEVITLLKKYEYSEYGAVATVEIDRDDSPLEVIEKRYHLGNVDGSISHIFRKKNRWHYSESEVLIRVFYYITLGLSLLIFIFRHTTVRTFFLSILAGVLITIFTALTAAFSRAEAMGVLDCMILYMFAFFGISLTVFNARKRWAVSGIAINLFTFTVVALPICVFVRYYELRQHQLYMQTGNYITPFDMDKYIVYAEVGGSLLLLILVSTYIGKVYRRWYSLPED